MEGVIDLPWGIRTAGIRVHLFPLGRGGSLLHLYISGALWLGGVLGVVSGLVGIRVAISEAVLSIWHD